MDLVAPLPLDGLLCLVPLLLECAGSLLFSLTLWALGLSVVLASLVPWQVFVLVSCLVPFLRLECFFAGTGVVSLGSACSS